MAEITNARISIICPVHNGLEHTKLCMRSLFSSFKDISYLRSVKIIFVDDGSTDGTSDWLRVNYPSIDVLQGDGNLWWSGAVNRGVKHALNNGSDYVLLINNDNSFELGYLEELVDHALSNKSLILGSVIMDTETKKKWSAGGFFVKKNSEFGMHTDLKRSDESMNKVDWLTGMGTLIHRSVFDRIGFWDAYNFPQYFGDSDFTLRATENDIGVFIDKKSVLWNNTKKSGINEHQGRLSTLVKSLFSIRSHYNLYSFIRFLMIHKVGLLSGLLFCYKIHGKYIGGFFKNKLMPRRKPELIPK